MTTTADIKQAAQGRWPEILANLGRIDCAILDGKHHPCPRCGGTDRFRMMDRAAGAVICNQCFKTGNGDGLSALQWLCGWDFPATVRAIEKYLGFANHDGQGHFHERDLIERIAQEKRVTVESLRAYGAQIAQRGKLPVIRFPVYNERGVAHSHFDLPAGDRKGLWPEGKGTTGIFLPMKDGKPHLPQPGETWHLVEGVKDSAALHQLGYLAVGLPGAELPRKYQRLFHRVHVIVIPDRDNGGSKGADKTCPRLYGIAGSVRRVTLPTEFRESHGADVRDVLAMPDGESLLRQAIEDAQPWGPPKEDSTSSKTDGKLYLTDLGNCRRLGMHYGKDLRYCHNWSKWLVWDNKRWGIDESGAINAQAKDTVIRIYEEAAIAGDEDEANKIAAHAKESQAAPRIAAMITLTRSEPGIPVAPTDLDRDPWLLNTLSGTIDLRTGLLRPHRAGDLITKLAPIEYNPSVIFDGKKECPTWLEFLERIMAGNIDLIAFLRRAIGYSLTGDDREQVLFFLYGTGSNGKSTLLDAFIEMLGDYAMQAVSDLLVVKKGQTHKTEIMDLFGKRFVACIEAEEGARLAEALVKQMTGGDRIRGRRCFEDPWEFAPTHKILLAANHKPIIRGTDHAIWRRIKLIPFTVTIPDDQQDKTLPDKLRKEYPGILRWAVEGCLEWQRNGGLGEPDEVREATAGYRAEMDTIGAFIRECCITLPDARVRAGDLFEAYESWSGDKQMNRRDFGRRLQERGFKEPEKGTGGYYWWKGIGLPYDEDEDRVE